MPDEVRRLALAVECFHKASLIHDYIEDADDLIADLDQALDSIGK